MDLLPPPAVTPIPRPFHPSRRPSIPRPSRTSARPPPRPGRLDEPAFDTAQRPQPRTLYLERGTPATTWKGKHPLLDEGGWVHFLSASGSNYLSAIDGSAFTAEVPGECFAEHGVIPLLSPPGKAEYNAECEASMGH